MRVYRSLLIGLGWVEAGIAGLLILFMIVAVGAEVFFRYILGSSLFWVEEGALIAFIWVTFIGAAVAAKARRHITIETLGSRLGTGTAKRLWVGASSLLVVFLATTICIYSYGYTGIQARTLTVSLPVNVPRSFMFAWPLCVGMASIALTYLYYVMDIIIHGFGDQRPYVAEPLLEMPA